MLENSVDVDPDFINDFDCGSFKFFMQLFEGDLPHQVVQGQKQTGVFRGLLIPEVQCLGHWTLFESSQTNGLPEWLLQRLELLFCLRSLGIDLGDNVIDILDPGLPLVFMLHFVDDVKDELLDALGLQTVGGDDDFIRLVLFDVLLELVLFVFVVGLEGMKCTTCMCTKRTSCTRIWGWMTCGRSWTTISSGGSTTSSRVG